MSPSLQDPRYQGRHAEDTTSSHPDAQRYQLHTSSSLNLSSSVDPLAPSAPRLPTSASVGDIGRQKGEIDELQEALKECEKEREQQIERHREEKELVWRKGLDLRVEVERLKRAKDAVEKEMKDAEKTHMEDLIWARRETLALEQKVKVHQEALDAVQAQREQKSHEQLEEAQLALDKIESLKNELAGLKMAKKALDSERREHLEKCTAARKQVLQLQAEIEELKREVTMKAEGVEKEREAQSLESRLVEAEIQKLQATKEELLRQRSALSSEGAREVEHDKALGVEREACMDRDGHVMVKMHAEDYSISQKVVDSLQEEVLRIRQEQLVSGIPDAVGPVTESLGSHEKDILDDLIAEEDFQKVLPEVTNASTDRADTGVSATLLKESGCSIEKDNLGVENTGNGPPVGASAAATSILQ